MLPDLVSKVYSTKTKKREEAVYPTTRVDFDSELKAQSFALSKPSTSQTAKRNIYSSQPASRYFDKKAIQQRIETRLNNGGSGKARSDTTASSDANFERVNQIMQSQHINMKVVTDNISRNILVYAPKLEGKEKFQSTSYPDSLRQIDRKILKYKKALEEAIKQQQQAQVEELILQEIQEEEPPQQQEPQAFDFLTGIGLAKQEEQKPEPVIEKPPEPEVVQQIEEPPAETIPEQNPYQHQFEQVRKAFSEIYETYQKQISKAFIKKDQPKARVRRKNPKINITSKNQISKVGAPFDEVEHLMRVYNKEHVPCQPSILVPSFQSKKDNIANTVLAYLKDYRPLLSGNKDNIPKCIQGLLDVELEMLKNVEKDGGLSQQQQQQQTYYSDEGMKNPNQGIGGYFNSHNSTINQQKNVQLNQNNNNLSSSNINHSSNPSSLNQVSSNILMANRNQTNFQSISGVPQGGHFQRHSTFKRQPQESKGQNGQMTGSMQLQQQNQASSQGLFLDQIQSNKQTLPIIPKISANETKKDNNSNHNSNSTLVQQQQYFFHQPQVQQSKV